MDASIFLIVLSVMALAGFVFLWSRRFMESVHMRLWARKGMGSQPRVDDQGMGATERTMARAPMSESGVPATVARCVACAKVIPVGAHYCAYCGTPQYAQ